MKVKTEKTPKWESELWSYVSQGDGEHCPLYSHCHIKQRGGWCLDDNRKHIQQLADCERFRITDYNFVECVQFGRVFKVTERLAQEWLKKWEVHCPPVPTEIVSLADNQYPVKVRLLPLKAYHGAIWRLSEGWVIQLRHDDTPATRRFTLFHEAFHILAHCRSVPVFRKRGVEEGCFNELLADCFAIFVLMPEEWVKEKWVEVKDLNQMAKIFDVPKSAMCIRLKCLGLI